MFWRGNNCLLYSRVPRNTFTTNRRKHFSTQFTVQLWNSLPQHAVETESLKGTIWCHGEEVTEAGMRRARAAICCFLALSLSIFHWPLQGTGYWTRRTFDPHQYGCWLNQLPPTGRALLIHRWGYAQGYASRQMAKPSKASRTPLPQRFPNLLCSSQLNLLSYVAYQHSKSATGRSPLQPKPPSEGWEKR